MLLDPCHVSSRALVHINCAYLVTEVTQKKHLVHVFCASVTVNNVSI